MTSALSQQCFINLCPASFCTPRPNYFRYFLTSYFCIPVPYNEKDIFFRNQFQKFLQVFIETFKFNFFHITSLDIDLYYCDIERCFIHHQEKVRITLLRYHFPQVQVRVCQCKLCKSLEDQEGHKMRTGHYFSEVVFSIHISILASCQTLQISSRHYKILVTSQ